MQIAHCLIDLVGSGEVSDNFNQLHSGNGIEDVHADELVRSVMHTISVKLREDVLKVKIVSGV